MVRLLLHLDIQADLLHQMALTELIPGRKGLVITLQKVQIVQPFGEAVNFCSMDCLLSPIREK